MTEELKELYERFLDQVNADEPATEISKCCRGELRQLKGYRFEYVEVE